MPEKKTTGGEKLLDAVERLIEDTEDLIARTELISQSVGLTPGKDDTARREEASKIIVRNYANRSAATGALTALPALVPGPGMLVAAVGGTFVDIALMLKHEVEMVLCLAHLHGFDISDARERRACFMLASLNVTEIQEGNNFLLDVAVAEMDAVLNYTPRQITKLLISLLGKVALKATSRGPIRALPLVGVVVCGVMNRVFTGELGNRCASLFAHRRRREDKSRPPEENNVVDARVRS